MAWKTYRLYRPSHSVASDGGRESHPCGSMIPTMKTFKARTQKEAEDKAFKFCKEAELRFGIVDVRDESPQSRFELMEPVNEE